jgi:hypothetical protein
MEACKGILQNSAQILFAGNQKEISEGAEETVGMVEALLLLAKPMALQGMLGNVLMEWRQDDGDNSVHDSRFVRFFIFYSIDLLYLYVVLILSSSSNT